MTCSVVEYENILTKSFSDANTLRPTGAIPRWKRKQMQAKEKSRHKVHDKRTIISKDSTSGPASYSEFRQPLGSHNGQHVVRSCNGSGGDRFIPNRAAMDMEASAHSIRSSDSEDNVDDNKSDGGLTHEAMFTAGNKEDYKSVLSSGMLGRDEARNCSASHRILSFKEKPPAPRCDTVNNLNILYSSSGLSSKRPKTTNLVSRQIPSAPSRILDAPELLDDYYLNLLSWSDTNVLAVALGKTVYLWNASNGSIQELCTQNESDNTYVSSVSWVQEGGVHLAVGSSTGRTQLWDVNESKQLRSMDGHTERVGSLSWNRHVLSTGGRDAIVVNHDVRIARHNVATLSYHQQEICGLSWNPEGTILASGGNDNVLCLWDATTSSASKPRYTLTDHQAAVKALAWSPHERNLLATGGGTADRSIKFWNATTGALLNSIDTGSQVCALQWNPHEREILSSHGFARNQICLWKYPSMAKVKELEGHTSRVLHMAPSPDGRTIVSAAADETLRFWNIFAPSTGKIGKRVVTDSVGVKSRKLSKTMHIR